MSHRRALSRVLFLLGFLAATPVVAQTPQRDRPPPTLKRANTAARESALARGWTALSSGQLAAASAAADEVLAARPRDHAALSLKIEALSAGDALKGLDAYERWLGSRTSEDPGLLEPVARGVLRELSASSDQIVRIEALKQLAACGIGSARQALETVAPGNVAADAALAALGDSNAVERLKTAVAAPAGGNTSVLAKALGSAGPVGLPALLSLLKSPDIATRVAAASALGKMRAEPARAPLQGALTDSDPVVRASAAVALARLGDVGGQTLVDQMLNSDVADLRLLAAEAWDGEPGPWVAAIRPLLDNRDGLIRFHAAGLIAPVDPEAARQVLNEGLSDINPVVRAEAARLVADAADTRPEVLDLARLRQLLRGPEPTLRLPAATAILAGICGRSAA